MKKFEKIKVVQIINLDNERKDIRYKLGVPKRFNRCNPTSITFKYIDGEYQLALSDKGLFSPSERLCVEELKTILLELIRLNGDKNGQHK